MGMPRPAQPTRGEQLGEAKDVYLQGTPGRGKSALLGAARGFLGGGGLAGAITGAASGAIDPRGLREQEFNRRIRPQILERFGLEDQERAQAREAEESAINNEYKRAQIGEIGSQGAYRSGQLDVARQNAERQQATADSEIKLNEARAEAARTGTPVYRDLVDADGVVKTFQVFPDGRKIPMGGSAQATFNQANIKSREGIAARHESATGAREASRGAGKTVNKGVKPLSEIRKYAKDRGIPLDEAKARAMNDGWRIVGN
jgi:hypothetical protein